MRGSSMLFVGECHHHQSRRLHVGQEFLAQGQLSCHSCSRRWGATDRRASGRPRACADDHRSSTALSASTNIAVGSTQEWVSGGPRPTDEHRIVSHEGTSRCSCVSPCSASVQCDGLGDGCIVALIADRLPKQYGQSRRPAGSVLRRGDPQGAIRCLPIGQPVGGPPCRFVGVHSPAGPNRPAPLVRSPLHRARSIRRALQPRARSSNSSRQSM